MIRCSQGWLAAVGWSGCSPIGMGARQRRRTTARTSAVTSATTLPRSRPTAMHSPRGSGLARAGRYMDQVHGDTVAVVDDAGTTPAPGRHRRAGDGRAGVALAVLVADCVAGADGRPRGRGRRRRPRRAPGPAQRRRAARPRDDGRRSAPTRAGRPPGWGRRSARPATRSPSEMRADVAAVAPAAWSTSRTGTPALDLRAGLSALCASAASRSSWSGRARRESADHLLLPPGRHHRPVRRRRLADVVTEADDAARRRRAGGRAGRRSATAIAGAAVRRRPRPGRRHAGRGDQDVPAPRTCALLRGARGARRGGEPRPGGGREGRGVRRPGDLRWHFVGQLQTNKAASVASYADVVHSVDRLAAGATRSTRGGAPRPAAASTCWSRSDLDRAGPSGRARRRGTERPAARWPTRSRPRPALRLRGLMAVAPLGADPRRRLRPAGRPRPQLRRRHPAATWVSAGMSGDLEAAVAAGATHVRVGSAILGRRPPLR